MAEPLVFPKKFDVPDGSQFNPGFTTDPVEATVRAAEGVVKGGFKLGYDTFALGVDMGASVYGLDGEKDVLGADDFWSMYNASNKYIEYGDPQRMSGISKGVANVTPFILSARSAATKLTDWGKAANIIKNAESFKSMLAIQGAAGVYADFVHTRKADSSLFEVLPEGVQKTEFAQWFMDKSDDSEFEGRFKHAIEGAVLGVGIDTGFKTAGYLLDSMKRVFHSTGVPIDEQLQHAERIFDGSGEFTDAYMESASLKGAMREPGDPVEQFFKNSDSTPLDELKSAEKRLKRPRGYSNKKRKTRLEKKVAKYHKGELAEWDDITYKPTETFNTAAEQRLATSDYSARQVMNEQSLRDSMRSTINEADAAQLKDLSDYVSSSKSAADDIAITRLNDPNATPESKKIAETFLAQDEKSLLRLNPSTSGDHAIEGAVRLMAEITGNSKLPKRGVRPMAQLINESFEKLQSGKTGKELSKNAELLAKYSKEMNYDFDQVARTMSIVDAMSGNLEEVLTAARGFRYDAGKEVASLAKQLSNAKGLDRKLLAKYMRAVERLDGIDNSLQGQIGSHGRMLGAQNTNPSEFAKSNIEWKYQTSINKNISKEAADKASDSTGKMMANLDTVIKSGDEKAIKKMIADTADVWTDAKALKKKMKDPRFIDLMESYVYSSYLSGISTLSSSVIMGNVVSTFLKSNLVPHFEAVIGTLSRAIGRNPGVSILDGFRANYVTLKQGIKSVQNLFAGDHRKTLDNLYHLTSSSREGAENAVMKLPEIKEEFAKLGKYYTDNDMYKKKMLIDLVGPMMSRATAVGNVMVRGIVNADKYFRGINNEVHLALEADRAWAREGGKDIFGSMIDKSTFVDRFSKYQRAYADISRNADLDLVSKNAEFDALFEGNKDLFNSVKKSVDHAEKIGKQATFQQDPEGLLSEVVEGLRKKADGHLGGKLAQLAIFPFTRTPMNMLDEVIKHTPASAVTARFWKTLKHGTDMEKVEVVAKMATGTAIMYSVGTLFASDRIQGSINPNDREAFKAAGIKEHSIKIGDTWYGYEKLGPVGVMLSTASDYVNFKHQDPDASLTLLFSQSLSLASDQSLYRTLREVLDLAQLEGPQGEDKGKKFAINRTARLIQPIAGLTETGATFFEAIINGEQAKYRNASERQIGDAYSQHKTILAEALKGNTAYRIGLETLGIAEYDRDLDVLGGPAIKHGNGLKNRTMHLFGVSNMSPTASAGKMELFRHGIISQTANNHTVKGLNGPVKISANQYKDLQNELFNGDIDMAGELDRLVKTPGYRKLSIGQQETFLRQTLKMNQEFLKARLFNTNHKLQRSDYMNGLMKVWRDTTVIDEGRTEAERWDKAVKDRAILRENNQATIQQLKPLLDTKSTTKSQTFSNAAREALKPLLGDTTDER